MLTLHLGFNADREQDTRVPPHSTCRWPDVRQSRVDVVESDGGDVREDESSSRPNHEGWREETEALLKPPHLKQVFWSRKNRSDTIIHERFIS